MGNENLNFKKKLDELEDIVNKIESGDLSLDDSLKEYEKGSKLIKELEEAIKAATTKVEKIIDTKGK